MRWPRRWIWISVLLGTLTLPLALPLMASGPVPEVARRVLPLAEPSAQASGSTGSEHASAERSDLDRALAVLWATSSVLFFGYFLFSALRLRRIRGGWSTTDLDGQEVLVTDSAGPALVGVFRPKVALPAWILDWRQGARDLVVRHETEHALARDPWLSALGTVALGLIAWNPSAWWARRRLVEAIEIDCDARVLASTVNPLAYAEVLLEVARWTVPVRLSPAALTATSSNLERRITMALKHSSPRRIAAGIALLALAGLVAVVAAALDAPDPPSVGYLGSLAVQAQEPPDLGGGMPGRLPYTPSPEQTATALAMHHPRVLSFGLAADQRVWFIIDADMRILHTGVGPAEGLHERVRGLHPESVTDNVLEITHETLDGLILETTWFVPSVPPPPGG